MKSLIRCAGSSLAGVTIEFGILSLLVSLLHVYYLAGAVVAGLAGLAISFALNRNWAFDGRAGSRWRQLLRHSLVVGGGIGLGMLPMWLAVSWLNLPYQVGWVLGGTLVFLAWTYPMQRWFTFRPVVVPASP
jgi:putative flippase GtrA